MKPDDSQEKLDEEYKKYAKELRGEYKEVTGRDWDNDQANNYDNMKKTNILYLDQENGKLGGVCAGIANWTEIDVVIIRLMAIVLATTSITMAVMIYTILLCVLSDISDHEKTDQS